MANWQGRSKGTPLGYRIFIFICRTLGVFPAYLVLRIVVFYYYIFSWRSNAAMYDYFHRRLSYGRLKSIISIYKNYFLLGQTILDRIIIMSGGKDQFVFDFEGAEYIRKIIADGKGGILMSAHLGNWEAASHMLERYNTAINVLMYENEAEAIKKVLEEGRGKRKFNVIAIKDDMSHVYELGEVFSKGELVCIHADRYRPGNKIFEAPFLNGLAEFPQGPFSVAAGFKVPVALVYNLKRDEKHYVNMATNLLSIGEYETKQEFMARLQQEFIKTLEQKVKEFPLQWYNYFYFWKKTENV